MTLAMLTAAAGWGFLHGLDWDHIAAIADLSSSGVSRRRARWLSLAYALGHASVVMLLGVVVVVVGASLPTGLEATGNIAVGLSLVAAGGWLIFNAWRHPNGQLRTARMAVLMSMRRAMRKRRSDGGVVVVTHDHPHDHGGGHTHNHGETSDERHAKRVAVDHQHVHSHVLSTPAALSEPTATVAATLGLFHGVGVATPTQVLVLAVAAGATSAIAGFAYLLVFLAALVAANTLVSVTLGPVATRLMEKHTRLIATVVGGASIAVGSLSFAA